MQNIFDMADYSVTVGIWIYLYFIFSVLWRLYI